ARASGRDRRRVDPVRDALPGRRGACVRHAGNLARHDRRYPGPRHPLRRCAGAYVPPGADARLRADVDAAAAAHERRQGRCAMSFELIVLVLDSAVRLCTPLVIAALAGLYSERSGIFDIGLEGKMLVGAFAAGAVAAETGSAWLGLLAAII